MFGSAGRRSDAGGCSPSQIYMIGGYGSNGQDYFTTFDGSTFTAEPGMTSVYQYGRNGHSGNVSSVSLLGVLLVENQMVIVRMYGMVRVGQR